MAAQLIQSRAATLRSRPWEIDERRLADEYDAAQERGGIARLSVGHLDQRDGRKEQPAHEDVVDHVGRCFDLPCLRSAPSGLTKTKESADRRVVCFRTSNHINRITCGVVWNLGIEMSESIH